MVFPHKLVAHPKASHEMAVTEHEPRGFVVPQRVVEHLGLAEGMTVADFGAGSGVYTIAAARVVGGTGHVYAIDVQKDLLARIRNTAVRDGLHMIDIIWGNVEHPHGSKLRDGTADVVIASNLLFQAEDKKAVLAEALRVLKPGGTLALIDWSEAGGAGKSGPHRDHVVTEAAAKQLAFVCGFTFVRHVDAGSHHWGMVFTSPKNS